MSAVLHYRQCFHAVYPHMSYLQEFPLTEHAGRPLSALTTALPALTSVHMTLLRHSKLAPYRFPDVKVGEIRTDSVPAASASTGITVSVAGVVSMLGETRSPPVTPRDACAGLWADVFTMSRRSSWGLRPLLNCNINPHAAQRCHTHLGYVAIQIASEQLGSRCNRNADIFARKSKLLQTSFTLDK